MVAVYVFVVGISNNCIINNIRQKISSVKISEKHNKPTTSFW
jgi:hypothetical protein